MVIDSLQTGQKFKKTEIGEIPVDWKTCVLGEQSLFFGRGKGPDYIEGASNIKAINQRCIRNGRVNPSFSRSHNEETKIKQDLILEDGDVCVNSTGTGTIGRVGLWKQQSDIQYFIDSHVTLVRLNPELMDSKFVSEILNSFIFQKVLADECFSGSTNQIELNKQAFYSLRIPSPPLIEQNKITNILRIVDDAIEKSDQVIEKTKQLKKGLMQQLLTRGIGNKKFKKTELGEIPEEWEVSKIKDVREIVTGSTPPTKVREYYGDKYLWATPVDLGNNKYLDVTQNMLSEEGRKVARLIPKNSVLVVCIGSTIGKVGMARKEMATNQQINTIVCNSDWDSNYVYYWLCKITKKLKDFSGKQAVPIINKTVFSSVQIARPGLDEQKEIGIILEACDKDLGDQIIQNGKWKLLKKGLMQVLLTGKVRVKF